MNLHKNSVTSLSDYMLIDTNNYYRPEILDFRAFFGLTASEQVDNAPRLYGASLIPNTLLTGRWPSLKPLLQPDELPVL
jgi:hypothetical protein